jgi:hypothetical protein
MDNIQKIYSDPTYFNRKNTKKRETTEIEFNDDAQYRLLQDDKKEAKDGDLKSAAEPPAKLPKYWMSQISNQLPKTADDHIERNVFFNAFAHHGLNKFEISDTFEIADLDKDGLLSTREWENFYDIFVSDFQGPCNKDGDW